MTEIDPIVSATGPAAAATASGASELFLMLLSDARLPTGAHTQSAGLEPAINAGMPAADVPRYISARLRTVVAVEAGAAVVARHLCLAGNTTSPTSGSPRTGTPHIDSGDTTSGDRRTGLARVDQAWRARTISPALRETSVLLGRGYQRLVTRLWPVHPAVAALRGMTGPSRPVVLGVAAACTGLSSVQLARLIGYDEAQTVAAAALKISPLDPVTATAWVIGAQNEIEMMAADVADLTDPADIPAFGAPLIEQWAEIHSATTQRLFRA